MLSLLRFLLGAAGFVLVACAVMAATGNWRRLRFDALLRPRDQDEFRKIYKDRHPF